MDINVWIALWAGFLSFISPCCLPLYPSYISYITGLSVNRLKTERTASIRIHTMIHTLFFILGFSIIFYTFGITAGLASEMFSLANRELISKLAAIMIIVMGLFLLGVFKPQLLMKEFKLKVNLKPAGYFGSLIIGIGFAAGWSPCIGPILGSIGAMAASEPGTWFPLITAYTLGFAVPFFIMAFFIGSTRWILKYSAPLMKIGGVVLIGIGILLYTGRLTDIAIWLNRFSLGWS